ncbi:MAG: hypothetical protein US68_C0010G0040 [Candidatus Shapirobacteria bacterium GW2011_GWE1_38_10]|uniref:Uncharacterized protein n=1 Tax=Candidatus Shapirobacteria bacterium GW2011_GWE1_38_10 TaxID=1618488 RepID=A0A0G0LB49_9BACT|nr:MAG: hypothetical protein US46_C0008G0063 [Candidatus Shapirobacteria bacterium GW2011_GWF2_37_20]KKQ49906.1 MAG: hypothetical protein US68_C0010G0040 [Candidatus Shapirobacteria bacterium GW2011_GWE1_38_10]KKQ64204.1 MAG: hypothetical protein US85_C0012G0036 [Candidatus Shapirobacteria bacterium GW2011_GWF1_38_23]HBP51551.1 hypothetical protein [Candidatus Shapirobacteria bacterium]
MPLATTLLVIFLIWVLIWFFRGGSFRLYASAFFSLYYLTGQVWVSVLLIGVTQNIVFLPLRFIGMRLSQSFKDFEEGIEKSSSDEAYLVFTEKVRKGDLGIIFYIFSFVVNAIAFLSAGRIFLIDFYTQKISPTYLYGWVPRPDYPLVGTNFNFPFFKITETVSVDWKTILFIWLGISLFFAAIKLLWRIFRIFLTNNKKLLGARINYNKLMVQSGGFSGTILILSIILLRNFPVSFEGWVLVADLTRQNTTMNLITAIGTFLTVMHASYTRHRIDAEIARKRGVENETINKVFRGKMKGGFRNALILGAGAFFITNQIPCAFELSVATFEVLYILSPYTFDKILIRAGAQAKKKEILTTNSD